MGCNLQFTKEWLYRYIVIKLTIHKQVAWEEGMLRGIMPYCLLQPTNGPWIVHNKRTQKKLKLKKYLNLKIKNKN